jgi:hypothetical protein
VKGGQYVPIIDCWYCSLNLVATGIVRLESRRSDPSSTCSCSHSHNYLAATGNIQGFLAFPAFKQAFAPKASLRIFEMTLYIIQSTTKPLIIGG